MKKALPWIVGALVFVVVVLGVFWMKGQTGTGSLVVPDGKGGGYRVNDTVVSQFRRNLPPLQKVPTTPFRFPAPAYPAYPPQFPVK